MTVLLIRSRQMRILLPAMAMASLCIANIMAFAATDPAAPEKAAAAPSADPGEFVALRDYVVFAADDGVHGRELWASRIVNDYINYGTKMIADIAPGPGSGDPRHLVKMEGFGCVLFSAWTQEMGRELWVARLDDGGAITVTLVKDIQLGPLGSDPMPLQAINNYLVFYATTLEYGREPWISNGTPDGTVLLKDIFPGRPGSATVAPLSCLANNNIFYFTAIDGFEYGSRLWRTDCTPAGTKLVVDVDDHIHNMKALGDKVIFAQKDADHGFELWVTDGTEEGTTILKDIYPGPTSSNPGEFFCWRDRIYFQAASPGLGTELWCTDGTEAGTQLVRDLNPGEGGGSDPYGFTPAGTALFFHASTAEAGRELWKTDGTTEGTMMVKDICPGHKGSNPYALCAVGSMLLFSANDGEHGEELWKCDGTPGGTAMVADIYPGPQNSEPYGTVAVGQNRAVFSATDPTHGRELWQYKSENNTAELREDINRAVGINPSSSPHDLVVLGDKLFFVVNDIEHGEELWVLDGLLDASHLVRDIFPGTPSSCPAELTVAGNLLYFRANDGAAGDELWRSDGTPEGTMMVDDLNRGSEGSGPCHLYYGRDALYFSATTPELGEELYTVTGPTTHIELVADIAQGRASSHPHNFTAWKRDIVFSADDGIHGEELWAILEDRSVRMVRDIAIAPLMGAAISGLTPAAQGVYFVADDGLHGKNIWITDATKDGTQRAPFRR